MEKMSAHSGSQVGSNVSLMWHLEPVGSLKTTGSTGKRCDGSALAAIDRGFVLSTFFFFLLGFPFTNSLPPDTRYIHEIKSANLGNVSSSGPGYIEVKCNNKHGNFLTACLKNSQNKFYFFFFKVLLYLKNNNFYLWYKQQPM